jgi:hypothetical protein
MSFTTEGTEAGFAEKKRTQRIFFKMQRNSSLYFLRVLCGNG